MGSLKVDPADLQALAVRHGEWSAEIGTGASIAAAGPPFQATSAAVEAVDDAIGLARRVLAQRLQATADKLFRAGIDHSCTEEQSAARIHELQ